MVRRMLSSLLGGRLKNVLIASFALVAALTVGLNAIAVSEVIGDYLANAETESVERDMDLARAFYQLQLDDVVGIGTSLASDPLLASGAAAAAQGQSDARLTIEQRIESVVRAFSFGGMYLVAVLDSQGELLTARVVSPDGALLASPDSGDFSGLPIVEAALSTGQGWSGTEIIPAEILQQVGLDSHVRIPLRDTPRAADQLWDDREGAAGLSLVGVSPLLESDGRVSGAVLAAHVLNNDFALVDKIREVAGVDTATIFFGDLRVSTNVMTEEGERAIGTRVSQDVYETVLSQGQEYAGRAYVVNEWFITRYQPLHDYAGRVVGILYVGARESAFRALVDDVTSRIRLLALVAVVLAGVIAVPIAQVIVRPIYDLVEANRRVAQGDMSARVEPFGHGEVAELGRTFNATVDALEEARQRLLLAFEDLAETLRRTQQELLHKEKLAAMGQLAAGVAHELNNPLGSILLYSNIVYKELPPGDSHRGDLELVISETNRCKTIVRNLLDFARQNQVAAQTLDLNALATELVEKQKALPKFEKVKMALDLGSIPTIQADPVQVRQVLINLMENAADSMDPVGGGTLTVATELAPFGQGVRVSVADTGVGISEENRAKLFTPFFTTKPVGQGMGLGLAIVYGIVKMHGGQIQVKSKEGEGTTITVTLPFKPGKRPAPAAGMGVI